MTLEKCFLCGIECECQWTGDKDYHIDWYNCENCGRFGISVQAQAERDQSKPLEIQDEKKKLAKFALQRKVKNKKSFLLYATDNELEVFTKETKSNSDLLKWEELVLSLDENGEMMKRRIGF